MNWTAASRDRVSAIPASSMITNENRPMRSAQSGRSLWWMDQVSLASVSADTPVASRSCAAAAAEGANPSTWPPLSRHAWTRVRMAVVFPAPAGAMANCSRAPEVHMERTKGVQVGITGAAVAVGERGRDQAGDVDLADPVPSLPGEQCLTFDEAQRILHGSLVRSFDLR